MNRGPPPSRPGRPGSAPSTPITNPLNRTTSNYEAPTTTQTAPPARPPPRPQTMNGFPSAGHSNPSTPPIPSRGGNPPPRTLPTTPPTRGGGQHGTFNGSATAQPSFRGGGAASPPNSGRPMPGSSTPATSINRTGGGSSVKPPPTPPGRRPGGAPPPQPPTRQQKRLSVSLHTDRQNVDAVVDLPINEDIVQQREVPPTPSRGTFNGSVSTSPSIRSPLSTKPAPVVRRQGSNEAISSPSPPARPPPRPASLRGTQQPPNHQPPPSLTPEPSNHLTNGHDNENHEKHERLRQEALKEIVNTERDYVQHLELVSEVFLRPLKEQPKVISAQELSTLFSNWELLVGVNQEILDNFDKDPNNIMVGQTFLGVMQYLKMYKIYCANQPTALKVLETLQEENSAFSSFLQDCLADPKCKGQNLFSYLIKPIQRLCKYPLLIKVLLEHTDPSHPDYQHLTKALVDVEEIVTYVNEGKRQAEKSQKVLEIALATEGGETLGLVTPTRNLEMEQTIEVIIKKGKPQQRKCMLFNDAVLLLKEAKKGAKLYSSPKLMSLGDIKVVNVSDTEDFSHGIELQYSSSKEKYVLIFGTEEDKQRWLREIKRIVKLYQQKKFEELKKEEEEKAAAAKLQALHPPPAAGGGPSRKSTDVTQSAPNIQTRRPGTIIGASPLNGSGAAPTSSPTEKAKKSDMLQRRSSFNNKTQISVIKPMQPSPNPPLVKYASKPNLNTLKGK